MAPEPESSPRLSMTFPCCRICCLGLWSPLLQPSVWSDLWDGIGYHFWFSTVLCYRSVLSVRLGRKDWLPVFKPHLEFTGSCSQNTQNLNVPPPTCACARKAKEKRSALSLTLSLTPILTLTLTLTCPYAQRRRKEEQCVYLHSTYQWAENATVVGVAARTQLWCHSRGC